MVAFLSIIGIIVLLYLLFTEKPKEYTCENGHHSWKGDELKGQWCEKGCGTTRKFILTGDEWTGSHWEYRDKNGNIIKIVKNVLV